MTALESPITVPRFAAMKAAGRKITMLTAYDYTMASLADSTGIEGILVGDSLSMVVQGRANTLSVTLEQMIYHAEMVGRAVSHALVVADMPFLTYQVGPHKAIANAGRILKQTRCQAVKLEGGAEMAEVIAAVVSAGIPVMGHLGLRPQSLHRFGGYSVQRDRQRLLDDAKAVEQAGAFSVVLECIPASLAAEATALIGIPTIGIGAGPQCDGQILVLHDLLGLTEGRLPRHAKAYADLRSAAAEAMARYRDEVRAGQFPTSEQSFS
jgi:3-methyl-2-oxobutanoate hydroxymethyltransferase